MFGITYRESCERCAGGVGMSELYFKLRVGFLYLAASYTYT